MCVFSFNTYLALLASPTFTVYVLSSSLSGKSYLSFEACNSINLYLPAFNPAVYSPLSSVNIVRYVLPLISSWFPTGLSFISNASDSLPD